MFGHHALLTNHAYLVDSLNIMASRGPRVLSGQNVRSTHSGRVLLSLGSRPTDLPTMDATRRPLWMRFCLKTVQREIRSSLFHRGIIGRCRRRRADPEGRNKTGCCVRSAATIFSSAVPSVPTVRYYLAMCCRVERLRIPVRSRINRERALRAKRT